MLQLPRLWRMPTHGTLRSTRTADGEGQAICPGSLPLGTPYSKLACQFHIIERTKPSMSPHRVLVAQALEIPLCHLKRRVSEEMLEVEHIASVSRTSTTSLSTLVTTS